MNRAFTAPIAGIICTFVANPIIGIIGLTCVAIVVVVRARFS